MWNVNKKNKYTLNCKNLEYTCYFEDVVAEYQIQDMRIFYALVEQLRAPLQLLIDIYQLTEC